MTIRATRRDMNGVSVPAYSMAPPRIRQSDLDRERASKIEPMEKPSWLARLLGRG